MRSSYYPAFIDLQGKSCVVVGGGKVAERKVDALLRAGARVKVISPQLAETLKKQKQKKEIIHIKRAYKAGDLNQAFLVIAATSDQKVNEAVRRDAPCLVNVVDNPCLSNFIVPSRVQRGPLMIAVSTSGASPALAREVRHEIEALYGGDFGKFVSFVQKLRAEAIDSVPDAAKRRAVLKKLGSKEMLQVLRTRGLSEAKKHATAMVQSPAKSRTKKGIQR